MNLSTKNKTQIQSSFIKLAGLLRDP